MAEREVLFGEGPAACPFVALGNVRDRRVDQPDHRHRCNATPVPEPRAIAHQRAYCLTPTFTRCPIFQDWAVRAGARPEPLVAAPPEPGDERAGTQLTPGTGDDPLGTSSTPGHGQGPSWAAPPPWTRDAPGSSEPQQMSAFDIDDAASGSAQDVPGDEPAIAPPLMPPLPPAVPPADLPAAARPTHPIERLPSLPVDRTGDVERDARAEQERQRRMEAERERRAEEERRRRADDDRRERERAATAAAAVPPFLAGRGEGAPVAGGHASPHPGAPTGGPPLPPSRPQAGPPPPGRGQTAGPPDAARQQAQPAGRGSAADRRDDLVPIWEREPIHARPTLRRRLSLRGSGDMLSTLTTLFAVLAILALIVFAIIAIPSFFGGGGGGPRPNGPVAGSSASPSSSVVTPPPTATPVPQETPRTYTIRSGDSLFAVGLEFGVTVDQLLAANPQITDPNLIAVGQVIVIPEPDFPVPGASGASPAP